MKETKNKISIKLDFYKEEYKPGLIDYHLSDDQSKYTSMPIDALMRCEEDSKRSPVVILLNNEPAGFFVLHGWEGVKAYSDNKDGILLRAYSINSRFQGQGIAKESLLQLDSFVKTYFPSKNEIILAVNHQNSVAQHLYKRMGYIDKGRRVMGQQGEQFVLHKSLC